MNYVFEDDYYYDHNLQVREITTRSHASNVQRRHSKIYDDVRGYRECHVTFVHVYERRSFKKQDFRNVRSSIMKIVLYGTRKGLLGIDKVQHL